MANSIVKTFIGRYIDLSKVVAISDAYFIDRMGFGGYFVGFEIHVQLMEPTVHHMAQSDTPTLASITYTRNAESDHSGSRPEPIYLKDGRIKDVAELQVQIDELVEQWIELQNEMSK